MIRFAMLGLLAATLNGCQQGPSADREEIGKLTYRVSVLEERIKGLEARLEFETKRRIESTPAAAPPAPKPAYELIGAGGHRTYLTSARCEAAKAALLQTRAEEDQDMQARGYGRVIYSSSYTCVLL